jgi:hypothetical protein
MPSLPFEPFAGSRMADGCREGFIFLAKSAVRARSNCETMLILLQAQNFYISSEGLYIYL